MYPGVFISLEGPDGSGKSSLLPRLASVLRGGGCDVVTTREPGSTPLGEQMRKLVLDTEPKIDRTGRADALLFAASRAQHVAEVIRPALARGAVVICDRYADSSLAYQGYGSQVPIDELRIVQRFATGGLVPDLTILLDLPVEAGLSRKAAEVTRFEAYQDVAYHQIPGLLAWRVSKLFHAGLWPTPVAMPVDADHCAKRAALGEYTTQMRALEVDWGLQRRLDAPTPEQYWRLAPPPAGWEGLAAR